MKTKTSLPAAIEAEKAILGALILYSERIGEVISLGLTTNEFYVDKHRTIFETIINMSSAGRPIDLVTLADSLRGEVDAGYLAALTDGLHKKVNLNNYVKEIKDKYMLREIIHQAHKISEIAYTGNTEETLDRLKVFQSYIEGTHGQPLSEKVKAWIDLQEGYFSIADICKSLQLHSHIERNNLNQIIYRLKNTGIIEPYGKKAGQYRKVESTLEAIDWKNADDKEYPIILPLDLSDLVSIYPKSIIIIAGIFNTGKTAFCLDLIRLNQDKLRVNYFSSELGANKLRQRLRKVETVAFPDGWKFNAIYRTTNLADAIKDCPDDLNVFDYIEIGENFWEIGEVINKIFTRLNKGIAVCCIQKSYGKELGRGGDFSAEKASLYLSIDPGLIKIIKAKEWRGELNPNQKRRRFKLVQGWKFIPETPWLTEEEEDFIKKKERWP